MEEKKPAEGQVAETQEKKPSEAAKMMGKMLIGIVLIVVGLFLVVRCWPSLWTVIKGCAGLFLVVTGLIFVAIARD